MTVQEELIRFAMAACLFGLILLASELWHRVEQPPVEWTRKFAHCTGGLVVAAFPWIFSSVWSVLALGLLFAAVMGWTRRAGLLRGIHGVERRSEGDLYYLLAVCVLFAIGKGQPVFYLIAILVLVIADTAAALFGSRYGKWTYAVEGGRRTLEGSGAFFLTAWLCVYLPLLLLTEVDRGACVVISIQLALLATCFEAISIRGNDNLIVPLSTFCLLVTMTPRPAEWIAVQLAVELAILVVLVLLAQRTRLFTLSGAVAAHLVVYGGFALGGPQWVMSAAAALAAYACVHSWGKPDRKLLGTANLLRVAAGALPLVLWWSWTRGGH